MFLLRFLSPLLLLFVLSAPSCALAGPAAAAVPDSSLVRFVDSNPGRKLTLHLYNGAMLTGYVRAVEDGVEIKSQVARSLTESETIVKHFSWEQIQKIEVAEKRSPADRAVVIGMWGLCAAAAVMAVLFLSGKMTN